MWPGDHLYFQPVPIFWSSSCTPRSFRNWTPQDGARCGRSPKMWEWLPSNPKASRRVWSLHSSHGWVQCFLCIELNIANHSNLLLPPIAISNKIPESWNISMDIVDNIILDGKGWVSKWVLTKRVQWQWSIPENVLTWGTLARESEWQTHPDQVALTFLAR